MNGMLHLECRTRLTADRMGATRFASAVEVKVVFEV